MIELEVHEFLKDSGFLAKAKDDRKEVVYRFPVQNLKNTPEEYSALRMEVTKVYDTAFPFLDGWAKRCSFKRGLGEECITITVMPLTPEQVEEYKE